MDLLTEKPKNILEFFLDDYNRLFHINIEEARHRFKDQFIFKLLTMRWYEALRKNNMKKAYSVYNSPEYYLDLIYCFIKYSRSYLKKLLKQNYKIKSFLDLGCGIGYSTWMLRRMFPNAIGYMTDLKNTRQWEYNKIMSYRTNCKLINNTSKIYHPIDLVFASEYFEHIQNPIEHLAKIMDEILPKYLVIANAFNTESIGHFNEYVHEGKIIPANKISRMFNKFLVESGYSKVKTGFWNNRPTIWRKNES